MITTIVAGIIAGIAAHLIIAMSKPSEAGQRDVRDKVISRFGDHVGGIVLSIVPVSASSDQGSTVCLTVRPIRRMVSR